MISIGGKFTTQQKPAKQQKETSIQKVIASSDMYKEKCLSHSKAIVWSYYCFFLSNAESENNEKCLFFSFIDAALNTNCGSSKIKLIWSPHCCFSFPILMKEKSGRTILTKVCIVLNKQTSELLQYLCAL